MTCPLCTSPVERDPRCVDWTVCLTCGCILYVDQGPGGKYLREALSEEFLGLITDTQRYGLLLLIQDEIRAEARARASRHGKGTRSRSR